MCSLAGLYAFFAPVGLLAKAKGGLPTLASVPCRKWNPLWLLAFYVLPPLNPAAGPKLLLCVCSAMAIPKLPLVRSLSLASSLRWLAIFYWFLLNSA